MVNKAVLEIFSDISSPDFTRIIKRFYVPELLSVEIYQKLLNLRFYVELTKCYPNYRCYKNILKKLDLKRIMYKSPILFSINCVIKLNSFCKHSYSTTSNSSSKLQNMAYQIFTPLNIQ